MSTPSDGGWNFTPRARRDLRRLDRPIHRRVIEALDRLVGEPSVGDVVKLTGSDDEYRLRVGDYRIRFTRDATGTVQVQRVLPRGRAYRG